METEVRPPRPESAPVQLVPAAADAAGAVCGTRDGPAAEGPPPGTWITFET